MSRYVERYKEEKRITMMRESEPMREPLDKNSLIIRSFPLINGADKADFYKEQEKWEEALLAFQGVEKFDESSPEWKAVALAEKAMCKYLTPYHIVDGVMRKVEYDGPA